MVSLHFQMKMHPCTRGLKLPALVIKYQVTNLDLTNQFRLFKKILALKRPMLVRKLRLNGRHRACIF